MYSVYLSILSILSIYLGSATALSFCLQYPTMASGLVLVLAPCIWASRAARTAHLLAAAEKAEKREKEKREKKEREEKEAREGEKEKEREEDEEEGNREGEVYSKVMRGAAGTDLPPCEGHMEEEDEEACWEEYCRGENDKIGTYLNNSNTNNYTNSNNSYSSGDSSNDSGSSTIFSSLSIPVLLLAIRRDPTHPLSSSLKLFRLLPRARLVVASSKEEAKEMFPKAVEAFLQLLQ